MTAAATPRARLAGSAVAFVLLSGFGPWRPGGAGTAGLGAADAAVAAGAGAAGLYANPATIAQVRQYTVETGFVHDPGARTTSLALAGVDATSAWGLAGGVGYTKLVDWTQDAAARTGKDWRGALALGLDSEAGRLMFGVAARQMDLDIAGPPKGRVDGWTGDLGAAVALGGLRFGVVWRNGLALDAQEAPERIATGAGYVDDRFLIEADGSWGLDANSGPIYRIGGAVQFGHEGPGIRAGYIHDQVVAGRGRQRHVTGGLGWRSVKVGIDAGFDWNLATDDVAVGLGLLLQMPTEL
ncbi:MAG: hypothetical protein EXR79_05080 [Myxococcales bacterium]|nr:hypothetical protein [Myxococcales bacterium]